MLYNNVKNIKGGNFMQKFLICILLVSFMAGCGTAQKSSTVSVVPTKAVEETKNLSAQSVMDELKKLDCLSGK